MTGFSAVIYELAFLAALAMIVAILLRKFRQVSDGVTTEKA